MGLAVDSTLDFELQSGVVPAPASGQKLYFYADGTLNAKDVNGNVKTYATADQLKPGVWWTSETGTPLDPVNVNSPLNGSGITYGDTIIREVDGEVFGYHQRPAPTVYDLGFSTQGPGGRANVGSNGSMRAWASTAALVGAYDRPVIFDQKSYDPGGNYNASTGVFTAPYSGYYQVNAQLRLANVPTAGTLVAIGVFAPGGATQLSEGEVFVTGAANTTPSVSLSDTLFLTAGQQIAVYGYSGQSGQTLNGAAGGVDNYFAVTFLAPNTPAPVAPNTGARAYRSAAFSLTAGQWVKLPVDAVSTDAGGHMDVATNHRYNVTAPGWYQVNGGFVVNDTTSTDAYVAAIYRNGAKAANGSVANATSVEAAATVSDLIYCAAGDYLELWAYGTAAKALYAGDVTQNYLSVVQVDQAVPQLTPQNTAARAYRAAAYTIPVGWQKIPLDTISQDTGSHFNVATGRYTVTTPGWYQVNGQVAFNVGSANTNLSAGAAVYKNGAVAAVGPYMPASSAGSLTAASVSDIIYCTPGDYLELYGNASGAWPLYVWGSSQNYLSVVKVDQPSAINNAQPPRVTALPSNPVDGQEVYYVADAANGVVWHLRYNATASITTYKTGTGTWECLGGEPIEAHGSTTQQTFTQSSITPLTGGPTLTVPVAGDYLVEFGAGRLGNSSGYSAAYDVVLAAADQTAAVLLGMQAVFCVTALNASAAVYGQVAQASLAAAGHVIGLDVGQGTGPTSRITSPWIRMIPRRLG